MGNKPVKVTNIDLISLCYSVSMCISHMGSDTKECVIGISRVKLLDMIAYARRIGEIYETNSDASRSSAARLFMSLMYVVTTLGSTYVRNYDIENVTSREFIDQHPEHHAIVYEDVISITNIARLTSVDVNRFASYDQLLAVMAKGISGLTTDDGIKRRITTFFTVKLLEISTTDAIKWPHIMCKYTTSLIERMIVLVYTYLMESIHGVVQHAGSHESAIDGRKEYINTRLYTNTLSDGIINPRNVEMISASCDKSTPIDNNCNITPEFIKTYLATNYFPEDKSGSSWDDTIDMLSFLPHLTSSELSHMPSRGVCSMIAIIQNNKNLASLVKEYVDLPSWYDAVCGDPIDTSTPSRFDVLNHLIGLIEVISAVTGGVSQKLLTCVDRSNTFKNLIHGIEFANRHRGVKFVTALSYLIETIMVPGGEDADTTVNDFYRALVPGDGKRNDVRMLGISLFIRSMCANLARDLADPSVDKDKRVVTISGGLNKLILSYYGVWLDELLDIDERDIVAETRATNGDRVAQDAYIYHALIDNGYLEVSRDGRDVTRDLIKFGEYIVDRSRNNDARRKSCYVLWDMGPPSRAKWNNEDCMDEMIRDLSVIYGNSRRLRPTNHTHTEYEVGSEFEEEDDDENMTGRVDDNGDVDPVDSIQSVRNKVAGMLHSLYISRAHDTKKPTHTSIPALTRSELHRYLFIGSVYGIGRYIIDNVHNVADA